jgi:hypothetical protein
MSAFLPARGAVAAVIVLLGTTSAREASAAGPGAKWSVDLSGTTQGAHWYVELIGTSCEPHRAAFEREIALACEAVGGTCRVASSPKEAELRAILDCSGPADSWTLETRTIEGVVIGKIDLGGAPDDRLREAAVEVARDAAPERALAVETLRTTLANEAPVHSEKGPEKLTLVLGGRATTTTTRTEPTTGGIHVLGGLLLGRFARGTLGFVGEAGGSENKAVREFRGGPGIAVGAPFDRTSAIGIAAEVGMAASSKYGAATASDGGTLTTKTGFAAYGQTTVTLQWPQGGLRPYAALSAAFMSIDASRLVASAEAGLAFAIF